MDPSVERDKHLTRRQFFGQASAGLGTIDRKSVV